MLPLVRLASILDWKAFHVSQRFGLSHHIGIFLIEIEKVGFHHRRCVWQHLPMYSSSPIPNFSSQSVRIFLSFID